jgi:hypothetical protein
MRLMKINRDHGLWKNYKYVSDESAGMGWHFLLLETDSTVLRRSSALQLQTLRSLKREAYIQSRLLLTKQNETYAR